MTVYGSSEIHSRPCIVAEFIRGKNLNKLVKPLPSPRVLALGLDLARGLVAAHRRGVLHRDIKLANAIQSENGTVKLLDFGLARLSKLEERWAGESREFQRARSPEFDSTLGATGDTLAPGIWTPATCTQESRSINSNIGGSLDPIG